MQTENIQNAVEIVMSWRGSVLETDLVDVRRPRSVFIGSEGAVRFLVPSEALPAGRAELLSAEDGRFFLRAPAGAQLVAGKDGAAIEASLDATGSASVELVAGVSGEVRVGEFAFYARQVGACDEAAAPATFDWRALRWVAAAFAFHAVVLGSFLWAPPNASALNLDLSRSDARYIEAHLTAPIPIENLLPELRTPADTGGGSTEGDHVAAPAPGGGAHGDRAETMGGHGRPTARAVASTAVTADTVNNLGIWSAMASLIANDGPDSGAFGTDALDRGPGGVGLYAALAAGVDGSGGPEMRGVGIGTCRAGEECGTGTIGVGPLATRDGHGGPEAGLRDRSPGRGPSIHELDATTTAGGLGREEVRRTIRRHRNEVYSCFEAALRSRPNLEGRVTLAFQIDTSGTVHNAHVVSSEGNVSDVGSCVAGRLANWTFDSAPGATGVTAYPFVFHTGE